MVSALRSVITNLRDALPRKNEVENSGVDGPRPSFVDAHRQSLLALSGTALVAPMFTGCATTNTASSAAASDPSPEPRLSPATAYFRAFEAKAEAINTRRGAEAHTKLNQEREALYREYTRAESYGLDVDHDRDKLNLVRELLYGTSDAKSDSDGDGMNDAYEVERGLDPASPQLKGKADVEGWTHDYIPYSNNPMIEGNTMLFYDLLVKQLTGTDPKLRYEEGASGLHGGDYFLASTLDEKDAEMTAAHDFNGDGVLTPGVEWDFLRQTALEPVFGTDGRADAQMDVSWWGHCDPVAAAGILFREPKATVQIPLRQPLTISRLSTQHGDFAAEWVKPGPSHTDFKLLSGQVVRLPNASITSTSTEEIEKLSFEPHMLKELASELVRRGSKDGTDWVGKRFQGDEATITLSNGQTVRGMLLTELRGNAKTVTEKDGRIHAKKLTSPLRLRSWDAGLGRHVERTLEPREIRSVEAENKRDVPPIEFHQTMLKWIGSDQKAGVMDKDHGPHVWNYSFDGYELEARRREDDPSTIDYTMWVNFSGGDGMSYSYSISYEGGVPTRGEWAYGSPNPDFFWRYRGGLEAFDHPHTADATAVNYRTVLDLLKQSYSIEDAERGGARP